MDIALSVWKPWWNALPPNRRPIPEQVNLAHKVKAGTVAIKGVHNNYVFGADENMSWYAKPYSNDVMEQEIKRQGLDLGIWGWTDLADPHGHAATWQRAVKRWQPKWCKIDGEGGTFKNNAYKTGTFLRALGRPTLHDGTVVPFYLQSYYRPDFHREVAWTKWFSYTDEQGEYILAGIAPQAYPIQSQDFVGAYRKMLDAYFVLFDQAGRHDLKWHVTLPIFKEWGWKPEAQALEDGILFLHEQLGDNLLVGVDYWRLWFLFGSDFEDILLMLADLDLAQPEPPEPPEPPPSGEKVRVELHYDPATTAIDLREEPSG